MSSLIHNTQCNPPYSQNTQLWLQNCFSNAVPIPVRRCLVSSLGGLYEFGPLLQGSHAMGSILEDTHFGVRGQKAKVLFTVNSWAGSKMVLKARFKVQGRSRSTLTTAMLTCKGSDTAFLRRQWISNASHESGADYPACEQHKSHFFSRGGKHERLLNGLCCTLAFSKCFFSFLPLQKCQNLTSKVQGDLRCQDMNQTGLVLQKIPWGLWGKQSDLLKCLPTSHQPLPSGAQGIRTRGPRGRLVASFWSLS